MKTSGILQSGNDAFRGNGNNFVEMQITFINKGNRNRLICEKKDGGVEIADIWPGLPFHDIAHFVVER